MKLSVSIAFANLVFLASGAYAAETLMENLPGKTVARSRGMNVEAKLQNDRSSFRVRVAVNHDDRIYEDGELMTVSVLSEKSGYLYLLYRQADGTTKCLFPNRYEKNNRIDGGAPLTVPTAKQNFNLRTGKPFGDELLMAFVSLRPIDVANLGAKSLTHDEVTDVDLETLVRSIEKGVDVENASETLAPHEWAEHHVLIKSVPQGDHTISKPQHRRYFFGVGISNYQDDRIRDLSICHKDAAMMLVALKEYGNLDAQILLLEEKATRANVQQAFEELKTKTNPGDEIIIYWSGHGGTIADTDGDETSDGIDEYLVPFDTNAADVANTAITDDTFGRWIQNLDGRKVVVILDACHSGGQSEGKSIASDSSAAKPANSLLQEIPNNISRQGQVRIGSPVSQGRGFMQNTFERLGKLGTKDIRSQDAVLLLSCRADEISAERRDGKGSVMTYELIRLIAGSNSLTLKEAYKHLRVEVPKYMKRHFPGNSQTPQLIPEQESDSLQLR